MNIGIKIFKKGVFLYMSVAYTGFCSDNIHAGHLNIINEANK